MQSQQRDESPNLPKFIPREGSPGSAAIRKPSFNGVGHMARSTSLIGDLTKKCADLRVECAAQTRILLDIEAQLKATERLLFDQLASTSPAHRVPTEVLCIIFRIHALDHAQSAWPLMHVCRAWRMAALTTRILWSRIMLTPPEWGYQAKSIEHRTYDGYEICSTPSHVIRALRHVGAIPLDLWINFHRRSSRGYDAALEDDRESESSGNLESSISLEDGDYVPTETSASSEDDDYVPTETSASAESSDSTRNHMQIVQSDDGASDSSSMVADGSDGMNVENDALDSGGTDEGSYTDSENGAEDDSNAHDGSYAHHSIRISGYGRRSARHAKQRHVQALIDSIKRSLQQPRLRSLRIDDKSRYTLEETFNPFDFTCLEVLRVPQEYRNVFHKAASEAGEIHTLSGSLSCVRLLQGKQLRLKEVGFYHGSEEIFLHEEQDLFNPHSLVTLDIEGGRFRTSPDFQLPKLESLRLRSTHPFWPIQCPNLTRLTLGPLTEYDSFGGYVEIVLPHLLYLSYIGRSGCALRTIDAPSLHTVQLKLHGARPEIRKGLHIVFNNNGNSTRTNNMQGGSGGGRLNPIVFWCLDVDVDAYLMARILSGMTRCQEFYSTNVDLNQEFFETLIPKKEAKQQQQESTTMTRTTRATKIADTSTGGGGGATHYEDDNDIRDCACEWSIPLPNLQRLVGYMPSGGSSSKRQRPPDRLRAMVDTFLERRKEAGVPMEKLSLRYSNLAWKDIVNGELGTRDWREGPVF